MGNLIKALRRWKEIILLTALLKIILFMLSPNLSSWIRWDAPHYINIAQNGYQTVGEGALWIVFYPLYPFFIKLTNLVFNNFNLSAIFVPVVFSFLASIALFELTLLDFKRKTAIVAVWYMNIFPTSFFLQTGYTESLFLTLSIATIYVFRKNLFLLSGLAGFLSSLTRINGVLIIPMMFFEKRFNLKQLPFYLLTPSGLIIYLAINQTIFNDPFYFTQPLYSNWYKKLDWPWIGLAGLASSVSNINNQYFYYYLVEVIALLFISLFGIYIFIKIRKSYGIYVLLNLLLITSTNFILSTPRYSLILFPLFIALAKIKSKIILYSLSISFLSLLFVLTHLYTQGKWAF